MLAVQISVSIIQVPGESPCFIPTYQLIIVVSLSRGTGSPHLRRHIHPAVDEWEENELIIFTHRAHIASLWLCQTFVVFGIRKSSVDSLSLCIVSVLLIVGELLVQGNSMHGII